MFYGYWFADEANQHESGKWSVYGLAIHEWQIIVCDGLFIICYFAGYSPPLVAVAQIIITRLIIILCGKVSPVLKVSSQRYSPLAEQ